MSGHTVLPLATSLERIQISESGHPDGGISHLNKTWEFLTTYSGEGLEVLTQKFDLVEKTFFLVFILFVQVVCDTCFASC